ncbi:hypothetical protein FBUS_09963 [Fasciolopsis buskii]|uniref:Uncharacterized protein n=1 Tax=Fasciolopsis buskii TaxID=27845 RepID=A0A8E0RLP5_9TREM|nr:hypothetical protein FBUS_09963 [Fasciolopsis buski]
MVEMSNAGDNSGSTRSMVDLCKVLLIGTTGRFPSNQAGESFEGQVLLYMVTHEAVAQLANRTSDRLSVLKSRNYATRRKECAVTVTSGDRHVAHRGSTTQPVDLVAYWKGVTSQSRHSDSLTSSPTIPNSLIDTGPNHSR